MSRMQSLYKEKQQLPSLAISSGDLQAFVDSKPRSQTCVQSRRGPELIDQIPPVAGRFHRIDESASLATFDTFLVKETSG